MYSDSRCRDVARYVSTHHEGKQESRSQRIVSSYSGILYPQTIWIEDFGGKDLDLYGVSLAN